MGHSASEIDPLGHCPVSGWRSVAPRTQPRPTWQCEFCGRFYSERTAKDHGYCIQAEDRRDAERAGAFDV